MTIWLFCVQLALGYAISSVAQTEYFPPRSEWERRLPQEMGLDPVRLRSAVEFAVSNEARTPRNLELAHYQSFGREPYGEAVGLFKERGPATGLIIRRGRIVAEWGEPDRVDMTFSVTKSFLSTTVGLAYDHGLIRSLQDRAALASAMTFVYHPGQRFDKAEDFGKPRYLELFAGEHNSKITWEHLLRQTSDWEGTLWGKPDWADRPDRDNSTWLTRKRNEPGNVYEYNDVRVNVLALAALNVWRKPLPQVLKEFIMDEIGASNTWRWYGYENSFVLIDGQIIQSVSGGGHWGGGMFINAYDMARFGLLTLRRGKWNGRPLLSERFIREATTPTTAQPTYGFMNYFLNTGKAYLKSAPESAYAHVGNGVNIVYVDPENDLVVVARWLDQAKLDEFVGLVLASVR
ncbi:serine hydrolase domain-containing protein [Leptolyngbya sp. 7M]|uniref:serine hydrolase domain-containing protein n=1 Tax=Leptolyngbya sp. 7M TaxID=2812896 RepID=UPI001B8CC39B|nr:serine hydrolase [Leptolyngbya sp. 7M]QYO67372.1 serine hydrolase [Leptolyngbya sp. 7M]